MIAFAVGNALLCTMAATVTAQQPRPIGDPVTTASGLRYVYLQKGTGVRANVGDVMVLHGIGRFRSGKEFWNSRSDDEPFEYVAGIENVIPGFAEGMTYMHVGDRVEFQMKPELGYGDHATKDIPANSTLVFDYELLAIHSQTLSKLMYAGLGNVDSTLSVLRAMPNLNQYYASVDGLLTDAARAGWGNAVNSEKVLKFGISLRPDAYRLYQAIAVQQIQRAGIADAITSYEAALRLNPRKSKDQKEDYTLATKTLAKLKALK